MILSNVLSGFTRILTSNIIQLVSIVVISRELGPEMQGIYVLSLLFPSTLAMLLNLGISGANIYYIGKGKVSYSTAWHTCIYLYKRLLLVGVGLLFIALFISYNLNYSTGVSAFWPIVIFPILLFSPILASFFQATESFKFYNRIILIQPAILLICVLASVLLDVIDVDLILLFFSISHIITLSVVFKEHKKNVVREAKFSRRYLKLAIRYGSRVHISNILSFLNYKIDLFMIGFFLNPASVGIYSIAIQISEKLWIISQSISTVLFPRLSNLKNAHEKKIKITSFSIKVTMYLTTLGAMVLYLIADWTVVYIFGSGYSQVPDVIIYMIPGVVSLSVSRVIANFIAAHGKPEINMYGTLVVLIVAVIMNLILIPKFGLVGGAIATSVSYFISMLLRMISYIYITKTTIFNLFLPSKGEIHMVLELYYSYKSKRKVI